MSLRISCRIQMKLQWQVGHIVNLESSFFIHHDHTYPCFIWTHHISGTSKESSKNKTNFDKAEDF